MSSWEERASMRSFSKRHRLGWFRSITAFTQILEVMQTARWWWPAGKGLGARRLESQSQLWPSGAGGPGQVTSPLALPLWKERIQLVCLTTQTATDCLLETVTLLGPGNKKLTYWSLPPRNMKSCWERITKPAIRAQRRVNGCLRCFGGAEVGAEEMGVSFRKASLAAAQWYLGHVEGKGRAFAGQEMISKVTSRSKVLSLIEVCDLCRTLAGWVSLFIQLCPGPERWPVRVPSLSWLDGGTCGKSHLSFPVDSCRVHFGCPCF